MLSRRRLLLESARLAGAAALGGLVAACTGRAPSRGNATAEPSAAPSAASSPPTGSPTPVPSASPTSPPPLNGIPLVSRVPSPVALENRRAGAADWDRLTPGAAAAEAYLDRASVAPGEPLGLHAAARGGAPLVADVAWYRLGWYGGAGACLMQLDRAVTIEHRPDPLPDPDTGRIEPGWPAVRSLTVGAWPSGLYLGVLRPRLGGGWRVPFVVRPPAPAGVSGRPVAPVLFVSAATTWQAYNSWGGESLYGSSLPTITRAAGARRAVEVSFDRPYAADAGAGLLRRWEIQFVRWMERAGRDVEYVADLDLALHPEQLAGRRLVVFAGHHEYWSRPMRDALAAAIAAGTNVAFLSANELYWSIRLGAGADGSPGRRITCYKSAARDPLSATDPALTTCRWREPPLLEPEARLIGEMYGHIVERPADWVVAAADHWLFAGTGLRDGDRFVNLVGQEYDAFFPELAPAGTEVLARSPVRIAPPHGSLAPPGSGLHSATIYTAPSGATVLAAGTMQWSWALDGYGDRAYKGYRTPRDARVEQITRNLFDRLGDGPR